MRDANSVKVNLSEIILEGKDNKALSLDFEDLEQIGNGAPDGKGDHQQKLSALEPVFLPKETIPSVAFYQIFRYATWIEWLALMGGVLFAAVTGLCLPLNIIVYGEFTTLLVDRAVGVGTSTPTIILSLFGGGNIITNGTKDELIDALMEDSQAFGISCTLISIAQMIVGTISVDLINYSALGQITVIRRLLLQSVLRQDMQWFDTNTNNNFAVRITEDIEKMKEGMGEKISIFIYLLSSFIFSVVVSFIYGWKLTLVVLSFAPFIIIATAVVAKLQSSLTAKELQAYSLAGNVAEEVLGSIRTVVAFGGEQKEVDRYTDRLGPANKTCSRKGLFSGIGGGIMWFIIYCSYALGYWYGVSLILDDRDDEFKEYTPAVLIIVFFGVLAGAQNMGLTSPHLEAFAVARGSAASVFSILNRIPHIDSLSTKGLKPKDILGEIEFKNVHFQYPARSDVKVLQGLNLKIKHGETVALVGSSGCGKSTILQLIQRLYDPAEGEVLVDGTDVSVLNVQWLRSHIGVVGQEPVLFGTTIKENIRYGNPSVSDDVLIAAARAANAHGFIKKLPNGYDTMVGERGAQLSGGQKQRIAIARALVRSPTILLLDEATSALDLHSEAKVQQALDRASQGRTTLIVTHRLSTITNADRIVFIDKGQVAEIGTHKELMDLRKNYYNLVSADGSATVPERKDRKHSHTGHHHRKSVVRSELSSDSTSVSSNDSEGSDESAREKIPSVSMMRLLKLNSPEWVYITVGCISALIVGASLPAFAVLFGEVYGVLSLEDADEVRSETTILALWFLLVGIVAGVGTFLQTYMFSVAGIKLTTRIRTMVFSAMMRQEMGWFDESKNSVGALCARLAGDCSSIQGATGSRIGAIVQSLSTIVSGVVISLCLTWKMTLVSMVTVPVVLGAVFLEARIMGGSSLREKQAMEGATKVAVEGISNIRTVASLGQEIEVLERYMVEINQVTKSARSKMRLRGIVFSLGQTAPFFGYALSLYYGGTLIAYEGLEYKNVIKVSEALIFGAWILGQALAFAPNFNIAKISAARIFRILDRVPKVYSCPPLPGCDQWKAEGGIDYKEIEFTYPTRPEVEILKGLDLEVRAGLTVALVGHSGCGKSTCIQLIQRLYDPNSGRVSLDGRDISSDITLQNLRAQLGIVSQEPVLFDRTIAENIAYGDNSRTVPMDEIIEAAKNSNIHNFITSMPLGYNTGLGSKGTQLSGGQKQRIAIARALVRNPRILLLDEATSALDTQSEKVVQAALDKAREGRTCIIIAHRLATIKHADVICVIDDGQVAEKGTHDELLSLGGLYTELYALQASASM